MRVVAAVLVLLAGCAAPVQWDKEGATAAALEEDSKECSRKARIAAVALAPPPLPQPGMISAPMRQEGQYSMQEAREFQTCMVDKGYREKR